MCRFKTTILLAIVQDLMNKCSDNKIKTTAMGGNDKQQADIGWGQFGMWKKMVYKGQAVAVKQFYKSVSTN